MKSLLNSLKMSRIRNFFDIEGDMPRRQNVVVVGYGGNNAGLVVDRFLGEFQTVIKPLGKLFVHLQGIGGSTILGGGEVALMLSISAMLQQYTRRAQQQHLSLPASG